MTGKGEGGKDNRSRERRCAAREGHGDRSNRGSLAALGMTFEMDQEFSGQVLRRAAPEDDNLLYSGGSLRAGKCTGSAIRPYDPRKPFTLAPTAV
jgi:hypothetical protein